MGRWGDEMGEWGRKRRQGSGGDEAGEDACLVQKSPCSWEMQPTPNACWEEGEGEEDALSTYSINNLYKCP